MSLQKHKNLLNYALSCLKRYKLRTIVVFTALVVALIPFSSVSILADSLVREAEISASLAPDVTVQYLKAGRIFFTPIEYAERIEEIEGVARVVPRIWGYVGIGGIGVGTQLYTVVGVELEAEHPGVQLVVEEGRFLEPGRGGEIVIGKLLSQALNIRAGDHVVLISEAVEAHTFTVVGIFSTASALYTADLILMSAEDARRFFAIPPGYVTDLLVYLESPEKLEGVLRRLVVMPNVRAIPREVLIDAYRYAYGARVGAFSLVWCILLAAIALISLNQALVVGHESLFEVGLLKSLGFSTLDIIEIRLIESLILGLLASSSSILVALAYNLLGAPGLREYVLGWAQVLPLFAIPVHVNPATISMIFAVAIFPLLFTTVVPAWINARADPHLAMRGGKV